MGASSTKSAATVRPDREWRQNQIKSAMIQKLATDVDAQYLVYQHYLGLKDMIHLSQTCHIWSHWIHSPDSAAHRSFRPNRGCVAVITNAFDLKRLIVNQWVHPYLYGCKIQPPLDYGNEWANPFRLTVSRWIHPPLLIQLASLKHIQHLSLNHVHHDHMTSEKITVYFTAASSTLRSLELSMIEFSPDRTGSLGDGMIESDPLAANPFLFQLHLLPNLEELRLSLHPQIWRSLSLLNLDQLPELAHFHTFVSNFPLGYMNAISLGKCRQLKYCSVGGFETSEMGLCKGQHFWYKFFDTLQECHTAAASAVSTAVESDDNEKGGSGGARENLLEYLDLSPVCINLSLLESMSKFFPRLHTINPYDWNLYDSEWSVLTQFPRLTSLQIDFQFARKNGSKSVSESEKPQVVHFLMYLMKCITIEELTLGHLTLAESQLQTILNHLNRLHTLTLIAVMLPPSSDSEPLLTQLTPWSDSLVRDLAHTVLGSRTEDLRIILREATPINKDGLREATEEV